MKDKPTWVTGYYPSYPDFFNETSWDILAWEIVGQYQGDYVVLLKDYPSFGFIVIGFGSCSGCDNLEAVTDFENWEPVEKFRKDTLMNVEKFDSAKLLLQHLTQRDTMNSWYCSDDGWVEAYNKLTEILEGYVELEKEES